MRLVSSKDILEIESVMSHSIEVDPSFCGVVEDLEMQSIDADFFGGVNVCGSRGLLSSCPCTPVGLRKSGVGGVGDALEGGVYLADGASCASDVRGAGCGVREIGGGRVGGESKPRDPPHGGASHMIPTWRGGRVSCSPCAFRCEPTRTDRGATIGLAQRRRSTGGATIGLAQRVAAATPRVRPLHGPPSAGASGIGGATIGLAQRGAAATRCVRPLHGPRSPGGIGDTAVGLAQNGDVATPRVRPLHSPGGTGDTAVGLAQRGAVATARVRPLRGAPSPRASDTGDATTGLAQRSAAATPRIRPLRGPPSQGTSGTGGTTISRARGWPSRVRWRPGHPGWLSLKRCWRADAEGEGAGVRRANGGLDSARTSFTDAAASGAAVELARGITS